jgi:hypothetical protein
MDFGPLSVVLGWVLAAGISQGEEVADSVLEARLAECTQAADGVCLVRLAAFEEAATVFEQHDLLAAIRLRRELGQTEQAYADALEFLRRFPRDPRVGEVAQEALLVGGLFEAASDEAKAADHYEKYLRDFGKLGGWDGFVVAHTKLGALRMRESCPIRGYFGACVEITKVRMECPHNDDMWSRKLPDAGFYWGESAKRPRRDPRILRGAKRHLHRAMDKADLRKAERDAAGSPTRMRALANARAEALIVSVSEAWDAYRALGEVPWNLDFTQPTQFDNPCEARWKKARFEQSSKRFMQWLTDMTKGFEGLRSQYKKAILLGGPESSLAATARFALVTGRVEEALYGGDRVESRCGRIDHDPRGRAEPLVENIVFAAEGCARMGATFAIGDDWAAYCRWELKHQNPADYPQLIELSPDPVFMSHAHEDPDYRPVEIEEVESPPWLRSRPMKRRCLEKREPAKPEKGAGRLGVLKMNEGVHLAPIFGRDTDTKDRLAYPDDFLSKLSVRFPPPWSR